MRSRPIVSRIAHRLAISFACGLAALAVIPAVAADLDLAKYRGKVVYLDFWASWCGPCRQSFPWMDEMLGEYAGRDFVVLAVNVDHDRALAQRFLDGTPANFPILYDAEGTLATRYKVATMPTAVLIDRAGHVRYQHEGFSVKKREDYESHIRELLAEPVAK